MHILYVDESGIEDLSSGTSHFVLLGVAIPSEQWKSLDSALGDVKATYGLDAPQVLGAGVHRRFRRFEPTGTQDCDRACREAQGRRCGHLGQREEGQGLQARKPRHRTLST